ncbi:MAG: polysaccharide deacetylase family protein [Marinilabiliaceae bacterium]
MAMRLDWVVQPPAFVRWLFPGSLWRGDRHRKVVYLTFDDGPVPEQTTWVLDLLKRHGIKATFFCVGDNVTKHYDIFERIVAEGHSIGNHTFNHLPYFRRGVTAEGYFSNIAKCQEAEGGLAEYFRAPHGHVTPMLTHRLTHCHDGNTGMFRNVVFWDVMPKDYDNRLTPQEVFANVRAFVRPGSVIVFHDSIKAGERMRYALTNTIEWLLSKGWAFDKL